MGPEGGSDEDLLRVFLRGDERPFTDLVRRHEDKIFALALRITGDRGDALDVTQEVFLKVFRKAASFKGKSRFSTWLYSIAINEARDMVRTRKRLPLLEEEPGAEPGAIDPSPPFDDAATLRLVVATALAKLPRDYLEAVVMHDLGAVPYEDIARLTGVALGTVKSRISRGRRLLARELEHQTKPHPSKRSS